MDEAWDFYFCTVDDRPASVALDLAWLDVAPPSERSTLLAVRVSLRVPRVDGLSDGGESDTLGRFEEALIAALAEVCGAAPVGRLTTQGYREFFLYGGTDVGLAGAVSRAEADGPYRARFRSEHDPEWCLYFDFLAPERRERQWMGDRRVVDQLRAHGDEADEPRAVDHFVELPDASAREAFRAAAAEDGFDISDQGDAFGLHLRRHDPVSVEHIHQVAWDLLELAERLGGSYDGWGAPLAARLHDLS